MAPDLTQPLTESETRQTCTSAAIASSSAQQSLAPVDVDNIELLDDDDQEIVLRVKWRSSTYIVELSPQETVTDLKARLFELTDVLPKRQKVIGLPSSSGRPPQDMQPLGQLSLKAEQKIMMIGTREEDIDALNNGYLSHQNEVIDDLDFEMPNDPAKLRRMFNKKLERRIESTEFRIMNAPRPGKKLLVLDLDYTLLDSRGKSSEVADWGRPGLHLFLASVYRSYDIVIWSQTSWRWLEAKLTGLSMLFASNYKVSFVLDKSSMFSVKFRRGSTTHRHEVKALEIIWRSFPEWNATNTIHVDDLAKNFALNPQSGLKIKPFRNAQVARHSDRELYMLDLYLKLIAERETDFTSLNHNEWKKYLWNHNPEGFIDAHLSQTPSESPSNS
ncbi:Ubiquitin [Gracilaria domingensis]|nr:Ubiquitin [Gracilaria domingensis]